MFINAKRRDAARNGRRGFTLVELAAVVLVIGILAAIAIPLFNIFQQRSRASAINASGGRMADSLFALATQSNRAANVGQDIVSAMEDLAADDAANASFIACFYGAGGDNAPATEDGVDPANVPGAVNVAVDEATALSNVGGAGNVCVDADDISPTSRERYGLYVVQQRFGDKVRAGCAFLPPSTQQGQVPVFYAHGDEIVEGINWDGGDFTGVQEIAPSTSGAAQFADVYSENCVGNAATAVVEMPFTDAGTAGIVDVDTDGGFFTFTN